MAFSARAAAALLAVVAVGCVRQEEHHDALVDLQRTRLADWEIRSKIVDLLRHVHHLQVRLAQKDLQLTEMSLVQAELMRRLDEAAVLNAELSERLRKAGQNVKDLTGARTELEKALADTRVRLEELRKKQEAAELRAARFRDLASRFKKMEEAGKLSVLMRNGQMVISIPNDNLFDAGKSALTDPGRQTVIDVAQVLKSLVTQKFQVAGHTDNVKLNSAKFSNNWELSTARAVEITKLLVNQGLDPSAVSAGGFAEFAPAAPNDTPEGRKKNRRMEIVLVPNADELISVPGIPESSQNEAPRVDERFSIVWMPLRSSLTCPPENATCSGSGLAWTPTFNDPGFGADTLFIPTNLDPGLGISAATGTFRPTFSDPGFSTVSAPVSGGSRAVPVPRSPVPTVKDPGF